MNIKEKNEWVHSYNSAKKEYEEIKNIVAELVKGISYNTTRKNCEFSVVMDEIQQNIDELENLYFDAKKLNEDDDNYAWNDASILELENTRRIYKIELALARGKKIEIPEDLREHFPQTGVDFDAYLVSIRENIASYAQNDRDFKSDIKDVVDGITEWLNYHGSNGYDFFQRTEDFDNPQDDVKGQLLENVGVFWDRYIKSIKNLANT